VIEQHGFSDGGGGKPLDYFLGKTFVVAVYAVVGKTELADIELVGGEGAAGELIDLRKLGVRGAGRGGLEA